MIVCDQENYDLLRNYASYVSQFLSSHEWVLEAYVSDFFYLDHWTRLPKSWQAALASLSTDKLSGLLDSGVIQSRQVLPLSLLSFARCTQTFSLNRECEQSFHEPFKELFSNNDSARESSSPSFDECSSLQSDTTGTQSNSRTEAEGLAEVDGKLPAFFRKHVKPKKQHEIQNLAKVINKLSGYTGCRCVVDVGSGLGHLSRLLSFGYGLGVTSVEAADTHAPKANKYDREVDRELKKKRTKIAEGSDEPTEVASCLPCHITSMIYPDTTMEDFLAIVNSQRQSSSQSTDKPLGTDDTLKRQSSVDECDINLKIAKLEQSVDVECRTSVAVRVGSESVSDGKNGQATCLCDKEESKRKVSESNRACDTSDISELTNTSDNHNTCIETDLNPKQKSSSISSDACQKQFQTDIKQKNISLSKGKRKLGEEKDNKDSMNWNQSRELQEAGFILTGLHACGDLTPTFLRFFVNCEAARGLASVGCCYMKISTDERGDNSVAGYPMSAAVSSLPNHRLDYNTRELACHFADTYSQRLKDCSSHLKIHSYRAALEWLAKQLHTDFKRTAVQIPAKKTNSMDFESYARLGLQKLGISGDLLTDDLLCKALAMTDRWQDVVAFYTIRLSLAPVVETLVLLDRMFFLYENGYKSALMPIFDPKLSPRNFVLMSWK